MTIGFGLVPGLVLVRKHVGTDLRSGERGSSRGTRRALPGPGRGGSGARVRAARQLRAAGPDGRTDDPRSAGCARRRRGADQRAVVAASSSRSNRGRPWARSTRPSSIGCASSRASRRPAAQPSCRWNMAGAARSSAATSRRCAAKKRRRRSIIRSAKATSKRWAPRCSTGRLFTAQDTATTEAVVVLNETAAKRYFNGESPVGREMLSWSSQIGPLGRNLTWQVAADGRRIQPRLRVVGVVADIQNVALGMPVEPAVYFPTRQFPFGAVTIAISARDTATALGAMRDGVAFRLAEHPARHGGDLARSVQHAHGRAQTADDDADRVRRAGGVPGGARGLRALLVVGRLAPARAGDSTHAGRAAVSRWRRPSCATASCSSRSAWPADGCSSSRPRARWPPCSLASRPSDAASTVMAALLLFVAALVASLPPAWRAMRADPVEGLRAE